MERCKGKGGGRREARGVREGDRDRKEQAGGFAKGGFATNRPTHPGVETLEDMVRLPPMSSNNTTPIESNPACLEPRSNPAWRSNHQTLRDSRFGVAEASWEFDATGTYSFHQAFQGWVLQHDSVKHFLRLLTHVQQDYGESRNTVRGSIHTHTHTHIQAYKHTHVQVQVGSIGLT